MFSFTNLDRRTGSTLNRVHRAVLLPAIAVLAAILVITSADAAPVSQSGASTAQATHDKAAAKKAA
jgi:hypothetical protein